MRRKEVALVLSLQVQDMFNLVVDLLGFRLLNKNVAIVRLQQLKGHVANSEFFVLQVKAGSEVSKSGLIPARIESNSKCALTSFR
jgi:hypothetical protein